MEETSIPPKYVYICPYDLNKYQWNHTCEYEDKKDVETLFFDTTLRFPYDNSTDVDKIKQYLMSAKIKGELDTEFGSVDEIKSININLDEKYIEFNVVIVSKRSTQKFYRVD